MEFSTASEGEIVHVWAAATTPDECTIFAESLSRLLEGTVANLPGFLEGQVLKADDSRSVMVLSHWTSRHAWARAEWNEDVGRTLGGLFQSGAKMVDSLYYVRSVVRSPTQPNP